jgi:hypothetical protein
MVKYRLKILVTMAKVYQIHICLLFVDEICLNFNKNVRKLFSRNKF